MNVGNSHIKKKNLLFVYHWIGMRTNNEANRTGNAVEMEMKMKPM